MIKSNPDIMITIPAKTNSIDFVNGNFQNVGTIPDMRSLYDLTDPGREYAVSLPVIYNDYAAKHLQSDSDHAVRLVWIKINEQDLVRAIEHPEYIEKKLRARNDGYYSATHIVKVSNPTSNKDQYMAVAISFTKNPSEKNAFHQITTIHPKKERDIIRADGTIKPKYKKL